MQRRFIEELSNAFILGILLSSFFYGYLGTQVLGGWLAKRFGGKWVLAIGVLVTSILTMLTPIAAKTSFYLLLAVRVFEGLAEVRMSLFGYTTAY